METITARCSVTLTVPVNEDGLTPVGAVWSWQFSGETTEPHDQILAAMVAESVQGFMRREMGCGIDRESMTATSLKPDGVEDVDVGDSVLDAVLRVYEEGER